MASPEKYPYVNHMNIKFEALETVDVPSTTPVLAILITAASGPIAFATSFEPCANAIEHAVITIKTAKTRSTV